MTIKSGSESQVNTYTAGHQVLESLVALTSGGWVVTWRSYDQGIVGSGVFQQAYNADGSKLGGETALHNDAAYLPFYASRTTALTDGGWVVSWNTQEEDGSSFGVYQTVFNADGSVQNAKNLVNTETDGQQYSLSDSIVALTDGGWVVTWQSSSGQDGDGSGAYQQAYNADGSKQGTEQRANLFTADYQYQPTIVALADGGWVTSWITDKGSQDFEVYLRAFYSDGSVRQGDASGLDQLVNTYTTGAQANHVMVALKDGGWVVTWRSTDQDGDSYGVYQQAYEASGIKRGGETQVNTHTVGGQFGQKLAALDDGGWVVSWTSSGGQDGDGYGVYQQVFNADGSARGGEVQVNTHTTNDQYLTDIVALQDGGWVAVWNSKAQDSDSFGVFLQIFNADGTRRDGEQQVNDFFASGQLDGQIEALDGGNFIVTWTSYVQDGSGPGVFQKLFKSVEDQTLRGTKKADHLVGDWGRDTLIGKNGKDTLNGKDGSDKLKGGNGDDKLLGGRGNDDLIGGNRNDSLSGGTGRDTLAGGRGNDRLEAGGGKDILVFRKHDGTDTVIAFENGKDKLDLKAFNFSKKHQALKHFSDWGGNSNDKAKFEANGTVIKIKGVDLSDINGSDILI